MSGSPLFWLSRQKIQRTVISVLFISAAICVPQIAAATDAKASKYYEDALVRYEKKDLAGAIIQLKNALQIDKSNLQVQTLLGKAYLEIGDVTAAEIAFSDALQLGVNRAEVVIPLAQSFMAQSKHKLMLEQPRFAVAGLPANVQRQLLLLRADASSFLNDIGGAIAAIKQARALDPRLPDSWSAEVPIRVRSRQFKEAAEAAEQAVLLAPASAEAWYQKGAVAHVSNNLPGSLSAYDRALKNNNGHLEARIARAGLYIDLARIADAAKDLDELKRTAPDEPRAAYLRALLAEREAKPEVTKKALQEVTTLIDPVPVDFMIYRPQLLMLNGLAHFGLNESDKAKQYLELFQKLQANTAASKLLAQIYLDEANPERAIQVLEPYMRANPGDGQGMTMLGSAMVSSGQYRKAATLMRQALSAKDNPGFRTVLGLSLLRRGNMGDGLTELETAYKKDAMQTQAAVALIDVYLRSGQAVKAVPFAQSLVKQQSKNAGFFNLLGMAMEQTGKPVEAKMAFEQASALNSAWMLPQINLARLEIAGKAYDAANKRLSAILKIDERNAEAMYEMFVLSDRQGLGANAQRWLEKAGNTNQKELKYGIALSEFHLRNGRPVQALEAIKSVSGWGPDDLNTLLAYAKANVANGNFPAAKNALVHASKLIELNPVQQLQIAISQLAAKDVPGAALNLSKALTSAPGFLPAQAMMTDVELRLGETAKAEKRAREILAKNPKRAIGHNLMGDVAMAQGRPALAMEAYQQAHHIEPSSETLLHLFQAMNGKGGGKASIQLAANWMKSHPKDMQVQGALADAYARSGDFASARGAYELLLKSSPNDGRTLNNLANILILLNDSSATQMAERAVAQNPSSASAIDTLGWALHRAGQADRALQLLRDARLRDPGNAAIRYHLAVVLAKAGRKAEAREELDALLKRGPVFEDYSNAAALLKTL